MYKMNDLTNFLLKHRCEKGKTPTHTRIGDKDLNIFGGSYTIEGEDLVEFHRLYHEHIFVKGHKEYLTEKQLNRNGPMAVDFDFRYKYDVDTRQHQLKHIQDMIVLYLEELKQVFIFEENKPFNVFIFQKPNVNRLEDGSLTKDGIHMIIGCKVDHNIQTIIRERILPKLQEEWSDLPIINTWETVLDEGISKGTTNWQLFGSRKPGHEAYELSQHFVISYDSRDGEFMIFEKKAEDFDIKNDFIKLTVQCDTNPSFEIKPKILNEYSKKINSDKKVTNKTKKVSEDTDSEISDTGELSKEQELLKLIEIERKDRTTWLRVCSCIKNIGMTNNDWLNFCEHNKLNMDTEKIELFYKIKTDFGLEIYYLQGLAKQSNPKGYNAWMNKYYPDLYSPLFTSGLIADFFINLYPNKFLCCDDKVYFFNGIYWETDDKKLSNLNKFVDKTFYFDLVDYCNSILSYYNSKLGGTTDEDIKNKISKITDLLKNINTMRKGSVRNAIIEDIVKFISNNNIVFDNNPYLFAFNNCVYDLKQGEFITPQPKFYITKTAGYNYEKDYDNNLETELDAIIDTIFPDKEVKEYYLIILSTGLCGLQLENLFIATGTGGNGKSLINSQFMRTLGAYGYKLPSHILLAPIKSGANPEVANMNNVRFILTQEPNQNKKICCSTLKEITGDKTLNVRDLYSSKCSINLTGTTLLEANEIPSVDEVNDAVFRRIRTIPFTSRFVSQEVYNTLEDKKGIFVSNPYYKTDEFQDKYKQALFNILIKKFAIFQANKYILPNQPKSCIEKCSEFLATCDDIYSWFESKYEKVAVSELCDAIPLSDIYSQFSQSLFFQNLSKMDKRKYNKKHFVSKIEENIFLRKFIKSRKTYHNNKQLNSDCLIGWKIIEDADKDLGY